MKKIICITTIAFLFSSICLAGEWDLTGSLNQSRSQFCSIELNDDRILVAGGIGSPCTEMLSCEIYDPQTNEWSITDSMHCLRHDFSLTKLSNGKILATGGYNGGVGQPTTISEIFDPETETWTISGELNYFRGNHTTVLLQNNKVLVVGGDAVNDYKGCEIYDPETGTFTLTGFCIYQKVDHTIELLPDGRVMAIGGGNSNYQHCEIYDPNTEIWIGIDNLNEQRIRHTSHLLPDGNIIAIAGDYGNNYNSSCEIYNFQTEQWAFTDSLEMGRTGHCSELLLNNQILVIGGHSDVMSVDMTTEILDANGWQIDAPLNGSKVNFSSEILLDETVLAIGKYISEIYTWNYMPEVSQIQGPSTGNIGEELNFSIEATDPNEDSIDVRIDWGDNEISEWTELQSSGSTFEFSHAYSQYGEYQIRSQVADQWYFQNPLTHNSISEWSEPFILTVVGIPEISISVDSLNFGTVYIGEDSTKTITFSNMGNGILEVELSNSTNEFSVWPESFNLEPEESLDVEVIFAPIYESVIIDTLVILSNDPEYPEINISLTGEGQIQVSIDDEFSNAECVMNNFPNPFNPSTTIKFSIQSNSQIAIEFFNIKGQKINTLTNNEYTKGSHSIIWDGNDRLGKPVSSGIYYYRLNVNGKIEAMKKCSLIK